MYESRLKQQNPGQTNITYDISDLFWFVDQVRPGRSARHKRGTAQHPWLAGTSLSLLPRPRILTPGLSDGCIRVRLF
eukprot:SAG22_NODE_1374_length_4563_cov_1.852823_6_plen_77_part_00